MLKKTALPFLSIVLGVIFLFSGYSKLYPIEPFEFTFVDLGIINWEAAPFIARIFIGLEFFIGVLFIFNFQLKKIAYKLSSITLIVFSIYLFLILFFKGNTGNCGCFGSMIEMTPLQALLKNGIMLSLIYVLYKKHNGWENKKLNIALTAIFVLQSFALPFILNPVALDYSEAYLNKPSENYTLALDSLYANATHSVPPKSLSKGKHVIAFMSLTCSHCKIAAQKMGIIEKRNPNISFYFALNGEDKNIKPFIEKTKTKEIGYCLLPGKTFTYLAGMTWPAIYLINNSIVEHEIDYLSMNQLEIEKWLGN